MGASQKTRRLIAVAIALFAANAHAQTAPLSPPGPIRQMLGCVSVIRFMQLDLAYQKTLAGDASARPELMDGMEALRKCSSDALPAAVKEAGDDAALVEAIKAFYVQDGSYIDSIISPVNRRVAERDRNQALSRVIMELKLAGK